MIPIGLLTCRKGPRVNLTGRLLGVFGVGSNVYQRVDLNTDGRLSYAYDTFATGEWKLTGSVGDYQSRFTAKAGTTPNFFYNATMNTWASLSLQQQVGWVEEGESPLGGRFLVEIRDAVTEEILTSAEFWSASYAP